ncbi:MAG: nucleoside/nucleotide kinase family protein [Shimia sp.]
MVDLDDIADRIGRVSRRGVRKLVAIAGPPASGKSTLGVALAQTMGPRAACVPMDGFHLDNAVLDARGLRARKGAPETFDATGFVALMARIAAQEGEIAYPLFDRSRDLAIAGAAVLAQEVETVIVEGNYLLLTTPPWSDLLDLWDLTIALDVPEAELRRRLLARWRDTGEDSETARTRVEGNDLPNAKTVLSDSAFADIIISSI